MQEAAENRAVEGPAKKTIRRRTLKITLLAVAAVALAAGGYWFYHRIIFNNFHVVVEGQVYRSAQPSPRLAAAQVDG